MTLETALRTVSTELKDAGVGYALVGGLAVSVRTEPRFTRDADLAVAVEDDAHAERVIRQLRDRGYGIEALIEQDAVGRLATVRLTRAEDNIGPIVDLLFASSGVEGEVVADAEWLELLPKLIMPVADGTLDRTGRKLALR